MVLGPVGIVAWKVRVGARYIEAFGVFLELVWKVVWKVRVEV
mgnify:CR=1 FL=1